jgi:peptide/nickel transport system permease protein
VTRYLLTRIGQGLIAVVIVLSVVFLVLNLSGDPIRMLLPPTASDAQVEEMREAYGFDRALGFRYISFLGRTARLEFGESIQTRRPAMTMVAERLPATLLLAASALLVAATIGIPLGTLAAVRRGTAVDTGAVLVSMVGQATPVFWIALLLILVFGVLVPLLPPSGYGSFAHLVLPAISIALFLLAGVTRVTRTATIEVLNRPFITVARARGLRESMLVAKHVVRNAAIPVVTQLGLQMRFVIGGSVVVESIFGWPGIGQLLAQAAYGRDYPVVIASTFCIALFIIVFNMLLDIAYSLIDPRVRLWGS